MAGQNIPTWSAPRTFFGDPLANWLSETAPRKQARRARAPDTQEAEVWQPCILYFPQYAKQDTPLTGDDLGTLLDGVDQVLNADAEAMHKAKEDIAINEHDLFYWLFSVIHYPDQISELIVFVRTSGLARTRDGQSDLEQTLSSFWDVLSTTIFGESAPRLNFRSIGPSLPSAGSAEDLVEIKGRFSRDIRPRFVGPGDSYQVQGRDKGAGAHGSNPGDSPMVISAIIDHGVPYTNARFSSAAKGTRILHHWRQGLRPRKGAGPNPSVVVGNELAKTDIDSTLTTRAQATKPPLLRDVQRPRPGKDYAAGDNPLGLSSTHGGMVLDLAAGLDPDSDTEIPWNILAVDLPPQIVRETSGAQIDLYVKSALNWIFYKSLEQMPDHDVSIVLTYAFGGYSGRRDGHNLIDHDFQLRLDRGELAAICVASGNGYLEDIHADLAHAEITEEAPLELIVPPASAAPTFVQIWFDPEAETLPFDLHFGPPGSAQALGRLANGEARDLTLGGRVIARAYFTLDTPPHTPPNDPKTLGRLVLAVAPSAVNTAVPVGRWELHIQGDRPQSLPAWIERSDSVTGFPNDRRQARFEHPSHRRLCQNGRPNENAAETGVIRRAGTLNDVANARGIIAAGAYRGAGELKRPALYSAAGGGAIARHPDLSTIAEFSDVRRNRLATGTSSSAKYGLDGTSAAAAIASRAAAEFILTRKSEGHSPDYREIKAALMGDLQPATLNASGCGLRARPSRVGAGVLGFRPYINIPRAAEKVRP